MTILSSWLKLLRSKFIEKTKTYNIFSSTWKCLFSVYSHDEKDASCNVINGELCY